MFRQRLLAYGLVVASYCDLAITVDTVKDPELVAKLGTATTQLNRLSLLPENTDWVFDFKAQKPFYNWAPGGVTNMNTATFPAGKLNGLTRETLTIELHLTLELMLCQSR